MFAALISNVTGLFTPLIGKRKDTQVNKGQSVDHKVWENKERHETTHWIDWVNV